MRKGHDRWYAAWQTEDLHRRHRPNPGDIAYLTRDANTSEIFAIESPKIDISIYVVNRIQGRSRSTLQSALVHLNAPAVARRRAIGFVSHARACDMRSARMRAGREGARSPGLSARRGERSQNVWKCLVLSGFPALAHRSGRQSVRSRRNPSPDHGYLRRHWLRFAISSADSRLRK